MMPCNSSSEGLLCLQLLNSFHTKDTRTLTLLKGSSLKARLCLQLLSSEHKRHAPVLQTHTHTHTHTQARTQLSYGSLKGLL